MAEDRTGTVFRSTFETQTADAADLDVKAKAEKVSVIYGKKHGIKDVTLDVFERQVTALIGPSGCGKSTFLRCLDRTNELIPGTVQTGKLFIDGQDVHHPEISVERLRRRVTMIAQKPDPFPKSIYQNVAWAPHMHGLVQGREETDTLVEACLRRVGLWNEVKDRLDELGTDLSGGQQQRLCIARSLAVEPEIVLMDEPCSALDPHATQIVEDLIGELRRDYTVIIVTHNLQQAARVSQWTAYFHLGEMVEFASTDQVFHEPQDERTRGFVTGRFG